MKNFKIKKTFFNKRVKVFKYNKFEDSRGSFSEIINLNLLKDSNLQSKIIQVNQSHSKKKNTIRGLHFQTSPFSQDKFVCVIKGKINDVFVDIKKNSKTYGKYKSYELSDSMNEVIFIPGNFAHGFCTLEPNTTVIYFVSNPYKPIYEKTLLWSDEDLKINWKSDKDKVIISKKDYKGILFQNLNK